MLGESMPTLSCPDADVQIFLVFEDQFDSGDLIFQDRGVDVMGEEDIAAAAEDEERPRGRGIRGLGRGPGIAGAARSAANEPASVNRAKYRATVLMPKLLNSFNATFSIQFISDAFKRNYT